MNFLSLLFIFSFCLSLMGEPELKIPQVKKETAKRLATTKCFQPEDWTEAAIVTDFSNHSTKEHRIPEKTIFYLQHDGENLWCVA
ncbi:MAG: hypothetical protein WCS73_12250, partial [Lentisphaeria bacterium]